MNKETLEYVKQWLSKANEDLIVIEKLTEFEIIAASSVCFHCQQLVEKYLKAFLISHGKEIIKTHNIEFLLVECGDIDEQFNEIDPMNLSDFGVDVRYPGDFYTPTNKETLAHKEIALNIKRIVEEKLAPLLKNKSKNL